MELSANESGRSLGRAEVGQVGRCQSRRPLYIAGERTRSTEIAHQNDLVAIQVGDEQQSDIENPNGYTKAWFDAAHASNYLSEPLLYMNSFFINNRTELCEFHRERESRCDLVG